MVSEITEEDFVLIAASPRTSFAVDGTEYNLHFDLNAIALLKKMTGVNISRQGIDLVDPDLLLAALYCGLRRELKDMTEEAAGALVDVENIDHVRNMVFQAITAAVVSKGEKAEGAIVQNPQSA